MREKIEIHKKKKKKQTAKLKKNIKKDTQN